MSCSPEQICIYGGDGIQEYEKQSNPGTDNIRLLCLPSMRSNV